MHSGVLTTAGSGCLLAACMPVVCLRRWNPAPLALAHVVSQRTAAPRAQELKLSELGCAALVPQALAQPSMPRLRVLDLYIDQGGGPSVEAFAPLWAAPWFSQLQELSLATDQGFGGPGLGPLRAAPLQRKLRIEMYHGAAAADGRALATAALPALRELRLHIVENGFMDSLAAAPWLGQIEWLVMGAGDEGPFGDLAAADGRALAAAPLTSIKRLGIGGVAPGFMVACAAAAWLRRLEHLDVRGEGGLLGDGGGIPGGPPAWAATPFTALVCLTLSHFDTAPPPPEASQFPALVAAPWFARLQQLHLEHCPLGSAGRGDGAGLRALAAAPLPNLTSLALSAACLSAADVSGVLSTAPWLASLTRLFLDANRLGVPGHCALALLHLPRLQSLSLDRTGLDCAGLAALAT
jgi:hypothetical protein